MKLQDVARRAQVSTTTVSRVLRQARPVGSTIRARVLEAVETLKYNPNFHARSLAAGAPLAVQYTKQAVNKLIKDALNTAFDFSTATEMVTFGSEDHQEALAALREKRKPEFKGR